MNKPLQHGRMGLVIPSIAAAPRVIEERVS
jgi:hypothetical protein